MARKRGALFQPEFFTGVLLRVPPGLFPHYYSRESEDLGWDLKGLGMCPKQSQGESPGKHHLTISGQASPAAAPAGPAQSSD